MLRIADRWFERRSISDDVTLIFEPHVHPFLHCNIWHVRRRYADLLVETRPGCGCDVVRYARLGSTQAIAMGRIDATVSVVSESSTSADPAASCSGSKQNVGLPGAAQSRATSKVRRMTLRCAARRGAPSGPARQGSVSRAPRAAAEAAYRDACAQSQLVECSCRLPPVIVNGSACVPICSMTLPPAS